MNIKELIGLTFAAVEVEGNRALYFRGSRTFKFFHEQECCENVEIEDICGDLADLVGVPILEASEVTSQGYRPSSYSDNFGSWTFYHFSTIKGNVTVRWYGTSNGYYSVSVDMQEVSND